jgi:hypothetical protein
MTHTCVCRYPCDCGSPAVAARGERDQAVDVLADLLRRQHLAAHDVPGGLPWRSLTDSERERWLAEARAAAAQGPVA